MTRLGHFLLTFGLLALGQHEISIDPIVIVHDGPTQAPAFENKPLHEEILDAPWIVQPFEGQTVRWSQAPPSSQSLVARLRNVMKQSALPKQSTIDIPVSLYHPNVTLKDGSQPGGREMYSKEESVASQSQRMCLLIPRVDSHHRNSANSNEEANVFIRQLQVDAGGGTCFQAFQNLDTTEDIFVCGANFRVPRAESWDFWRTLEQQDKYAGNRGWQTLNELKLKAGLLDLSVSDFSRASRNLKVSSAPESVFERDPFFADGTRKSYLEFDISKQLNKLNHWIQETNTTARDVCIARKSLAENARPYSSITKVADLTRIFAPETGRMAPTTETSMRVFFDPGWRLDATIIGNHLSYQDRLSIKLNGCSGKMDDLSIRVVLPVSWYIRNVDKSVPQSGPSQLKNLFYSTKLYSQALQFSIRVDALQEEDATTDWRRAAFLIRRLEKKAALARNVAMSKLNITTVAPKKPRSIRSADDNLKMYLCLYADPNEHFGIPVGSTQFALGTTKY
eukprot:Gregarina_sp_Poly_1__2826@NODE_1789_length_3327_cov_67_817791_g851_i1_p1_GENE_NODE_1789_length_3327_cov_67_817791_g851_i1NODE_1789_length_3327_cov_67_817791_g851_i1_p1_ORF_typecomplete_len508_score59_49_NODE_1789_length_3327_cov_67_817791_g851_i11791702